MLLPDHHGYGDLRSFHRERQVIASAVSIMPEEFGCYREINRETSARQEKLSPDCEADRDSPPGQCLGQKPLPEGKSA